MRNKRVFVLLLIIAVVLAGCQQAALSEPNNQTETPSAVTNDPEDTSSPKKEGEVKVDSDPSSEQPVKQPEPNNDVNDDKELHSDELDEENRPNVSSDDDHDKDIHSSENTGSTENDASSERDDEQSEESSTANTYQLMNLSLNQPLSSVHAAIGEPLATYKMQSQSGHWNVHEYNGFSIGYNEFGRIEFIEVYDDNVDAGFGSSVGVSSSTDSVIAALGVPSTQSSYVLNYRIQNVTLKFDLDPINQSVVSIKLFSEN